MPDTMQPYSSTQDYTVLRIKRKATEPPLSSLVIQNDPGPARKKREIKGRGVFRLAETVPDTWKGTGEEGMTLKERIRGLLSATGETIPTGTPPTDTRGLESNPSIRPPIDSLAPNVVSPPLLSPPMDQTPAQAEMSKAKQMRYRVVPPPSHRRNFQSIPPTVMTYAQEAAGKALNFVDAEAISSASAGPSKKESLPSAEEQQEMAPFLSMLEDVLKMEPSSSRRPASRGSGRDDGETYVYDLYYKDIRPTATMPLPLGVGDGVHIGALLGYGDDDDDDGSDVSEPEDEADEDSNDEDFYRNDYPEDEDADEDMQGFRDAFDDSDDDQYNNGEEGDEPGLWDYR